MAEGRALALVYGALLDEPQPPGGLWLVHKHVVTGDLLGPYVRFGVPTRVVYARLTADGWVEAAAP